MIKLMSSALNVGQNVRLVEFPFTSHIGNNSTLYKYIYIYITTNFGGSNATYLLCNKILDCPILMARLSYKSLNKMGHLIVAEFIFPMGWLFVRLHNEQGFSGRV